MSIYPSRYITLLTGLLLSLTVQAEAPASFSQAKKVASRIYEDHQVSFYCGCNYHKVEGKLPTGLGSCGYTPHENANRVGRVEWEYVVPACLIGHQRQWWQ